jgi:competence/damage-inducible protein CinA-like protein
VSNRGVPGVELVVVGDELLSGRVVDTNSALVGRRLTDIGLQPERMTKVGDDGAAIQAALGTALADAELVIIIGGMGPTHDDKTLAAVAAFLDRGFVVHRPTLAKVRALFLRRGVAIPKLAERQALVVRGATLLPNPCGMVPGMLLRNDGRTIALLPGVPAEMKAIVEQELLPRLSRRFRVERWATQTIRTFGVAESTIAEQLSTTLVKHGRVQCGFYPSASGVDIVLRSTDRTQLVSCRSAVIRALGNSVYEAGDASLEEVVGRLLKRRRTTIATAESCTGGLIGHRLTNVPGSSEYYRGGVVSYANEVKKGLLGVTGEVLRRHGAVSAETVRQMACGIQRLLNARVGLSVSGIAGPGGGTRAKPVGLVFICVGVGDRAKVEEHHFFGDRRLVKERAASAALDFCRRVLEDSV